MVDNCTVFLKSVVYSIQICVLLQDYSATDDTDSSDEEEHEEIYSPTITAKTIYRVKLR